MSLSSKLKAALCESEDRTSSSDLKALKAFGLELSDVIPTPVEKLENGDVVVHPLSSMNAYYYKIRGTTSVLSSREVKLPVVFLEDEYDAGKEKRLSASPNRAKGHMNNLYFYSGEIVYKVK